MNKRLCSLPYKTLLIIFKVDKRGTLEDKMKNEEIEDAWSLTAERLC